MLTACILGGVSVTGGFGKISNVVAGVLILGDSQWPGSRRNTWRERPGRVRRRHARPYHGRRAAELLKEIEKNEQRKREQAANGLDGLTYFVLCNLTDDGFANAERASKKAGEAFAKFSNWRRSEAELRELQK